MASSLPKPPPPPPPDLEAVVREVTKGYELATELHSLLRQVIPRGDGRLESACRLSKFALQTLASALSTLKPPTRLRASDPLALEISLPCSNGRGGGGDSRTSTATTEVKTQQTEEWNHKHPNSRKRSLQPGTMTTYEISEESQNCKTNGEKKNSKTKMLRTSHLQTWTTITCTPFNDGHQWRKYGEKKISQCTMPRCYYRCTHKDDQGCPATKQVQQKDCEDPPTFVVTYNKQHTCRNRSILFAEQFVIQPPITDPCQLSL